MNLRLLSLLCILSFVVSANSANLRQKRFLVSTIKNAVDKVVDTAKDVVDKVVDKGKDVVKTLKDGYKFVKDKFKKAYDKAKKAFKNLGKAFKNIDFDEVVDKVLEVVGSDFTINVCVQACEKGSDVIFSAVKMDDLSEVAAAGCDPACEGAMAKISDLA